MKRIFIDTNVLVYAHDQSLPAKRARADSALASLATPAFGPVVSTQVMQEFYNTLTRKLGFARVDAKSEMALLNSTHFVLMTPALIAAVADLHALDTISFWDALIVAAAQSADCDEIWSEDLQTNRSYGNLKIVNPFAGI